MICNVAYLKTRSSNLLVSFLFPLSVIPSSLSVCAVGRVRRSCVSPRVYSRAHGCVLARVQLSAISWRRSDLWNPNCVNHGLCVGDIKPPSTLPASPAGFTHTHTEHTLARMCTHETLKGTFAVALFIYKSDDGRSVICCGFLSDTEMKQFMYLMQFYKFETPFTLAQYIFTTTYSHMLYIIDQPLRCAIYSGGFDSQTAPFDCSGKV